MRFVPEVSPLDKFYVCWLTVYLQASGPTHERFELVLVEELDIPNFDSIAFKYGILELNTNVKPTFLKKILAEGVDQMIYFDPEIFICARSTPYTKH